MRDSDPSAAAVAVATAVAGPTESAVAAALSGRRDLSLVRRCADVAELLSLTEVGLAAVVVISEGFPGMDADIVDRLRRNGCAVLGVVDPDRESSERLRAWGVVVLEVHASSAGVDATPSATGRAGTRPSDQARPGGLIAAILSAGPDQTPPPAADPETPPWPGVPQERAGRPEHTGSESDQPAPPAESSAGHGRLIAVWGPPGAPGRTTTAVCVAGELAGLGHQVLLLDADTYAASTAQVLGLLDESPGLVAGVRAGLAGRLDPAVLARLAPSVSPGLRVLTGLSRAARWPELRPAGLQAVLAAARQLADFVVVDLASPLEEDDELSYDTLAPRRNGTTVDVLRGADDILAVGSADPIGLQRLVRGLQELSLAVPGVLPHVVVNRVRADAVGRNPKVRIREALERFAGVNDLRLVPDDRAALDKAVLAGRTLTESAPDSPARLAFRDLAAALARLSTPAMAQQAAGAQPEGRVGRARRRKTTGQ